MGLAGYYREFIPQFADIAYPLNALTRKGVEFIWTEVCQESFDLLKQRLLEKLILVYPDPNKPYVLFMDASKYAWSCVLTQEYTHIIAGKEVKVLHPITYMSQINWACLTKEAYAIYMSVKKLAYYLEDADITLRSDHLPLTAVCVLTGYVFCEPLKTKQAKEVVQTYIDHIYCKFGGSLKILMDNGTEFKNELFDKVAKELGVIHKQYTAPYHPAFNGRIEGFHNFLKACLSKHISQTLEWNQVIPLACAAYNFMPSESSKEALFFLMFGRDPVLPLNTLLVPTLWYMGDSEGFLSLETLKNLYT